MNYILNGGNNELMILESPHMIRHMESLNIQNLLIIPLAIKELATYENWDYSKDLSLKKIKISHINYKDTEEEINLKLSNADAIYFPGGSQSVLLKRLRSRKLDQKIKEMISNNSIKLISGGSAGEMVLGEKVIIGHKDVTKVVSGLDFIHGYIIDSHFSNRDRLTRLQQVLKDYDYKYKGIGVDENTAVLMNENFDILDTFGEGNAYLLENEKVTKHGSN